MIHGREIKKNAKNEKVRNLTYEPFQTLSIFEPFKIVIPNPTYTNVKPFYFNILIHGQYHAYKTNIG